MVFIKVIKDVGKYNPLQDYTNNRSLRLSILYHAKCYTFVSFVVSGWLQNKNEFYESVAHQSSLTKIYVKSKIKFLIL